MIHRKKGETHKQFIGRLQYYNSQLEKQLQERTTRKNIPAQPTWSKTRMCSNE